MPQLLELERGAAHLAVPRDQALQLRGQQRELAPAGRRRQGAELGRVAAGDGDAGVFVLGMIVGAGFAHNFGLAATADKVVEGAVQVGGLTSAGMVAVLLGLVVCLAIGFTMRERNA